MLFRQLEYFVALARERHFARAAAACYVSQPALSEAIRKLEHELDVPLVRRGKSFEDLTPEGEVLLPWARRVLADRDGLEQAVVSLRGSLTGELRLGVIPGAATSVALLTDPFCAAHPLVRVQVWAGLRSADVLDKIRRFELDAGIVYSDGVDLSGIAATSLYAERRVVVARADLLPDGADRITWAEAAELPMCLLHRGMRGRDVVDHAAAAHGVTLSPRLEADSLATLLAMVGAGRWASIVPRAWTTAHGAPSGTRVVELGSEPGAQATVSLVRSAGDPESVLARALEKSAHHR